MAGILVAAHVRYKAPVGVGAPAKDVAVEVLEVDPDAADVIWIGKTNADGNFSGTTKEWQDKVQAGPVQLPAPYDAAPVLRLKLTEGTQSTTVDPYLPGAMPVIVLPWGQPSGPVPLPAVPKEKRRLLIVNNVVQAASKWRPLYQFLEDAGDRAGRAICGPAYQEVRSLNGTAASLTAFANALAQMAPTCEALDVVLNMHGSINDSGTTELVFAGPGSGENIDMTELAVALNGQSNPVRSKLRLLYSTACFGSLHRSTFIQAGFTTAVGAKRVNANSVTEYTPLLSLWSSGARIQDAVAVACSDALRVPIDTAMNPQFSNDVNSRKDLAGNGDLTISSAP